MLRTIWFWVGSSLLTLFCFLTMPFTMPFGRVRTYVRWWGRGLLFFAGVRLDVTGAPPKGSGPYLVVANHCSMLDIPACLAALPLDLVFVSRPFFFKVPLMGWGMSLAGYIALDPRKPREAAKVLGEVHRKFERGISLLLFPEGTRSPDGVVARYKRGPFLTAIENGVRILPIRTDGLHLAMPKGSKRVFPRRVPVVIGDPLPTDGLERGDARRVADEVEAWTKAALD